MIIISVFPSVDPSNFCIKWWFNSCHDSLFFMISHWHDITYRTQSLSGNHGFNNGSANSLIAVTNINQKHELYIQILFFQPKLNTTNHAWFAWYYQTFWFSLVYQYSPPGDIEVDTRPLSEWRTMVNLYPQENSEQIQSRCCQWKLTSRFDSPSYFCKWFVIQTH